MRNGKATKARQRAGLFAAHTASQEDDEASISQIARPNACICISVMLYCRQLRQPDRRQENDKMSLNWQVYVEAIEREAHMAGATDVRVVVVDTREWRGFVEPKFQLETDFATLEGWMSSGESVRDIKWEEV